MRDDDIIAGKLAYKGYGRGGLLARVLRDMPEELANRVADALPSLRGKTTAIETEASAPAAGPVEVLVQRAIASGRLIAGGETERRVRALAAKDLAKAEALITELPTLPKLPPVVAAPAPRRSLVDGLTETEKRIAAACGVSLEAYAAEKARLAREGGR